jgi:hypothetical protein
MGKGVAFVLSMGDCSADFGATGPGEADFAGGCADAEEFILSD